MSITQDHGLVLLVGFDLLPTPCLYAGRHCAAKGVMKTAEKAVRQSISLPPRLARQVGSMAKSRKLSKNRMLLELIENGIEADKRKQQQFFALAERFRNEQDPEAANRLGDELGRMVFGG